MPGSEGSEYVSKEHGLRMEFEATQELPGFGARQTALEQLHARVSLLEVDAAELKKQIATNTLITSSVKDDTAALVELFRNLQTIGNAFVWLGKLSKWISTVAAAFIVIWAVIHFMGSTNPPSPPFH